MLWIHDKQPFKTNKARELLPHPKTVPFPWPWNCSWKLVLLLSVYFTITFECTHIYSSTTTNCNLLRNNICTSCTSIGRVKEWTPLGGGNSCFHLKVCKNTPYGSWLLKNILLRLYLRNSDLTTIVITVYMTMKFETMRKFL